MMNQHHQRSLRPSEPMLHIRIVACSPEGQEECLTETKPSAGGNHASRLFSELEDLVAHGTTWDVLQNARVQTFTNETMESEVAIEKTLVDFVVARLKKSGRIVEQDETEMV